MRGLTRTRWVVGAAAVALAATACGGGSEPPPPSAGGTAPPAPGETAAGSGGTFSFYVDETRGGEVLDALYSGLISYDPETSQPVYDGLAVADGITSDDQKVWTIKLNEGWTFHNGEPVTAQSFVDAWNFTAYGPNANGNSYFFENVEGYDDLQPAKEGKKPKAEEMSGLKVIDETTFEVTLKAPFSQYPLTVGYTAFYPMAEECLADTKACEETPIGTGPFMMDGSWDHNRGINVVKYPDYQGEPAKADGVEFKIYSDVNTAYNDLLGGGLDIMDSLPPEKVSDAKANFPDRFIERESSSFTYVGFPLYDERFQNPDLRKAFSMAIDRQTIIDQIFNGAFTPSKSVVSPVVAGSREAPCGQNCEYNPEMAKQLLEQAGGWDGTLTLWFNSGAGHDRWMEAVANYLRQNLGINDIKFTQQDFAEYLANLDDEKVDGPFRLGWVMDYPSPQNYLEPLHSTNGSSNNTGYSNEEFDQLVEEGNEAPSIEEGIDAYNRAEDVLLQDMPVIPMWFGKVQAAYSDRVDNVVIDAFTSTALEDVTVVSP
jgi:ABC-type oligopeptide transport system substrate-binding subunit